MKLLIPSLAAILVLAGCGAAPVVPTSLGSAPGVPQTGLAAASTQATGSPLFHGVIQLYGSSVTAKVVEVSDDGQKGFIVTTPDSKTKAAVWIRLMDFGSGPSKLTVGEVHRFFLDYTQVDMDDNTVVPLSTPYQASIMDPTTGA